MKKSRSKAEFGDFQTPFDLAAKVCRILVNEGFAPAAIVEPTCGRGSFLLAALDKFPSTQRGIGLDINSEHLQSVEESLAGRADGGKVQLLHASFFDVDWDALLAPLPDPLLVIGNPPWVTNADLGSLGSANLPVKSNFQQHSGLDALTGKSNFDISEWMLIRLMERLNRRSGVMAMLVKTAVARKVLHHAWAKEFQLSAASLHGIDAAEHFGASVDACLLTCRFQAGPATKTAAIFPSLEACRCESSLGWRMAQVVADVDAFDQWNHLLASDRRPRYVWRSGVKHDCSQVMELYLQDGRLYNKMHEQIDIEPTLVYPMMKSSDVAQARCADRNRMIVTQTSVNSETHTIKRRSPKTWEYLTKNAASLDGRRSAIYRNRPQFSVFGVGKYTFAPYKVAISGFYKSLRFLLVPPHEGKPVVFDDTVYFIACQQLEEAEMLAGMLNSDAATQFLSAFIFWDAKRPITVDVLRRLDLHKLAEHLGQVTEFDRFDASGSTQSGERLLF